jgi:hypothetical protein
MSGVRRWRNVRHVTLRICHMNVRPFVTDFRDTTCALICA